jgi:peptide/nickel transport system permease protein
MGKYKYLLVRSGQTIVLLVGVLALLFFFFRLLPGDYTDLMLFRGASEETIAAVRQKWGLDEPLYVQFWTFISNLAQGDAGTSHAAQKPVLDFVKIKLFNSFILIAPAITAAYLMGSIIGAVFARARNTSIEKLGLPLVIFLGSFPAFFSSLVLVIIFAVFLNWFPTSGLISYGGAITVDEAWWKVYTTKDFAFHYALPFTAVFLRYLFGPTLVMRTSMVDVIDQDFMFYHRVTGLSNVSQYKHLLRHSMLPVITLYPVSMTRAIGGMVLVEKVFNWPGIGTALINAVLARDFPVIQFVFFLVAAFVIISNFAVDIIYGIIDPRISLGED